MGKFKVGDRVEYTGNHKGFASTEHVGKVGTIYEIQGGFYPSVKFDDGTKQPGCFEGNIEKFQHLKIGDRVRYRDELVEGEGVIHSRDEGGDGKYFDWVVEVAEKDRGCAYFVNNTCRKFTAAGLSMIVQDVALQIEAGKFYKTREGQKVGPAKLVTYSDKYPWSLGQLWLYRDDGKSGGPNNTNYDIIAEWFDEPAVAVAASNDNATKPKFKVGDRVVTRAGYTFYGSPGVVTKVNVNGELDLYKVRIDANLNAGSDEWAVRTGQMEPYSAPTNPAIVALIENGQPLPSRRPFIHADEASASKEAARLASKNKGQSFGVYVLTQTVKEDVVYTYKHEWQRLAANGDKIPAIKALREITGLGLKATKDAVEHWIANDQQYSRVAA